MYSMLYESTLHSIRLFKRGKIRDSYTVSNDKLLLLTTDRLSAFDVVMKETVPGKGKLLNQMTNFWFEKLAHIIPNHMTDIVPESVVAAQEVSQVFQRSAVVKRLNPIPIEAVVRGYLTGSAWKSYQLTGSAFGIKLPAGMRNAEKLPMPIFTPAIKAKLAGQRDQNINFDELVNQIGGRVAEHMRESSIRLYQEAFDYAKKKGIIIADTKFEFAQNNGSLILIDEVLTPDSSRFWIRDSYKIGENQHSLDKQCLRDWLEMQSWNKKAPAPSLNCQIVQNMMERYNEVFTRLIT